MLRPAGIASVMSLNSSESISFEYENIERWLTVDCNWLGLIVQWEEPHPNDVSRRLTLFRVDLQKVIELATRLKVKELTFNRVNISSEPHNPDFKSSHLEQINFIDCRLEFDIIRKAVRDCPKLKRVTCQDSATICLDADLLQDNYLGKMINIVRPNYRLLKLDYNRISDKIIPGKVTSYLWKTDEIANRKKIVAEYATLQGFISRNLRGHMRCYAAIKQILLIKRFRPKSLFRHVNHDVIKLICQLLHDSLGTAVWCS